MDSKSFLGNHCIGKFQKKELQYPQPYSSD